MRSLAVIAALFLAIILTGCGLFPEVKDETSGWSANKLYTEAKEALNESSYDKSIKYFEKLESRYPYGRFAQQAQIEIAYAYWKSGEPASAVAACERFIKLHPNHPNVDYVYYLRGLVNFNEDLGLLGNVSNQDMTERDPKGARESFDAFKELVNRYPDSKYAADSVARMKYLVNALASHEVLRGPLLHEANSLSGVNQPCPVRPEELPGRTGNRRSPVYHGQILRPAGHERSTR